MPRGPRSREWGGRWRESKASFRRISRRTWRGSGTRAAPRGVAGRHRPHPHPPGCEEPAPRPPSPETLSRRPAPLPGVPDGAARAPRAAASGPGLGRPLLDEERRAASGPCRVPCSQRAPESLGIPTRHVGRPCTGLGAGMGVEVCTGLRRKGLAVHQRRAGEADLRVPLGPQQEGICSASTACKVLSAWGGGEAQGGRGERRGPSSSGSWHIMRGTARQTRPGGWGLAAQVALGQLVGVERTGAWEPLPGAAADNGKVLPQGEIDSGSQKSKIKVWAGPHSL